MKVAFSRTTRWMQDDSSPLPLSVLLLLIVASLSWATWFFAGKVRLYAVAVSARTEVDQLALVVQTPVTGVVSEVQLVLGRYVQQGDILLVLDSTAEQLQLKQELMREQGLRRTAEVRMRELVFEHDAYDAQARALNVASQVAQARGRVANTARDYALEENKIMHELRRNSLATGLETLRSASEVQRQQAEAIASSLEASRVAASGQTSMKDRLVSMAEVEHEIATLQGDIEISVATSARLRFEIERRSLRAAVSGVIADISPAPPGSTLVTGQRLAVIVPPGNNRLIARFAPSESIGRLKPGQSAIVRFDAFPWTEYGVVPAKVAQVASEPQEGMVRTELEVLPGNNLIPVRHGMTGSIEIQLEETSPFHLLLRAAGQLGPIAPASLAPSATPPSARLP